jgi:hypothetical protein
MTLLHSTLFARSHVQTYLNSEAYLSDKVSPSHRRYDNVFFLKVSARHPLSTCRIRTLNLH